MWRRRAGTPQKYWQGNSTRYLLCVLLCWKRRQAEHIAQNMIIFRNKRQKGSGKLSQSTFDKVSNLLELQPSSCIAKSSISSFRGHCKWRLSGVNAHAFRFPHLYTHLILKKTVITRNLLESYIICDAFKYVYIQVERREFIPIANLRINMVPSDCMKVHRHSGLVKNTYQ